jgi:hypothetical protein
MFFRISVMPEPNSSMPCFVRQDTGKIDSMGNPVAAE